MQFQTTNVTIPAPSVHVHVPAASVASSLMHQNSQCLCSSSSSPFPEWRVATQRCRGSEVALRGGDWGGGALWNGPDPNVCSSHNIRMWETDRKNNNSKNGDLGFSFQHLWVSILFLFTTLDHRTQEPKWLVNEISVSAWLLLSLLFLFLALVSSLCCSSIAVKQTPRFSASKRCGVMGWALFCVWAPSTPAVAIRARWRERHIHDATRHEFSHCLISPLVQNIMSVWLKPSSLRLAVMETRWCWVFRFCLFIKVECWLVFYPGARVSLCRHVRVPPISDCALILYMN